jgi:hypothetical protein
VCEETFSHEVKTLDPETRVSEDLIEEDRCRVSLPSSAITKQWASFANRPFPLRSSKADGALTFVPRSMMRRPQVPMSSPRSKRQDGPVSSR